MTPERLVFRPQAEAEVLEIRQWYEQRGAALGEEFRAAVNDVFAHILEHPLIFPRVRGEIRRAILRRFPYAVYFRIAAADIVVLAVIHGHRHARQWRSRR